MAVMMFLVLLTTPLPAEASTRELDNHMVELLLEKPVEPPPVVADKKLPPKEEEGKRARKEEGKAGETGVLPALELNENEQTVFATLKANDELSIDEIIRACGLPSSAVNVALFSLEMKRLVKQLPGKMFVRNQ